MAGKPINTIKTLLSSTKPEEIQRGLALVKKEISQATSTERESLLEMVSALFYIDPLDEPDLVPFVDEAISIVAQFGVSIIPLLVQKLDAGDLKAQMAVAHALGRIGADAIKSLILEYESSKDPARRSFILYALGKIKSPEIAAALSLALEAAQSPSLELRDTATVHLESLRSPFRPRGFQSKSVVFVLKHYKRILLTRTPASGRKLCAVWGNLQNTNICPRMNGQSSNQHAFSFWGKMRISRGIGPMS